MTPKQHAVMWMGLLLVLVKFFGTDQFHLIWSDIISGSQPGKLLGKVPRSSGRSGGTTPAKPGTGGSSLGVPMRDNGGTMQA